ncbi:hypothetical protein UFOVP326_58 [uncultured Caudovirales phage]|uniref:Uncharacterized protein n=1 Tax=uncultured Caudovirales phage TaxID=2100421 RepID=A0A6J5LU95_9CAUD|nr:hypothetical protein UFOVP326_58 [uncultured Caudovirales phage]
MTLLLDLGPLPAAHCDDCLEDLFKAMALDPEGDEGPLWRRHENPWLAAHVEACTRRHQAILQALQDGFARALLGEELGMLAKADAPWLRWTPEQFEEARAALAGRPKLEYTLDDWMLLVDFLIQDYLPDGVIQSEAEYVTVRAGFMGKVMANMQRANPTPAVIDTLAELVPTEFAKVPLRSLSPVEVQILRVAKARAAENISAVSARARHTMKGYVIEHVQAGILGQKEGTAQALRSRLFDSFGQLNRDFRRIAVTEAGEACNQGFVAAQGYGQKVKRQEAYRGACDFCKSIDGKVFTVVSPNANRKDGETEIWLGKNNVGRSASPRRREGAMLVERQPSERWWPAAGLQHPNCRGAWVMVSEKPPEVSAEFDDWLQAAIKKAQNP